MLSKKGVMGLTFKKGFPFLLKRVSDYCMLRGFAGRGQFMSSKNNQGDLFMPAAVPPPSSENQLMDRARSLAGLQIGQLADQLHQSLPETKKHGKGLTGH